MPVQQEMLQGDYFDWDNEKEVHKWEKLILNGTENWLIDDVYQEITEYSIQPSKQVLIKDTEKNVQSNYFKGIPFLPNSWMKDNSITVLGVNKIRIMTSRYTTVDEFKAVLKSKYDAGTPVIIYYKTAISTELDFTDEQKAIAKKIKETLHTYKNITHIYSTDETSPNLNVEYAKDPNTQNNNLQNQIDEIKQLISTTQTSAMLLDNLQKEVESEVE